PHTHVPAGRRGSPARGGLVGPFGHLAARPPESRRGDCFSLTAIGARPDGIVHALQCDQPAAAVADRGADLDVELLRLGQGAANDAIASSSVRLIDISSPENVASLIASFLKYEKPRFPAAFAFRYIGAGEGIRTPDPNL